MRELPPPLVSRQLGFAVGVAVLSASVLAGCSTVSVADQRLVSKPNMTFSDDSAFVYDAAYHSVVEPGTSASGGGQASGCTSCQ